MPVPLCHYRGVNELFLDLIFVGVAFRAGMNIKHSHASNCAYVQHTRPLRPPHS